MQKFKNVVYLDQNFASNLAKAIYIKGWKDTLLDFYRELNDLISDLTSFDLIICPTSPFHAEEAEMGQRVRDFIWHFVEQLGYGLSFKHSAEIRTNQVINAALAYCGLPTTQHTAWMTAFNRDPHVPVGQLPKPDLLVDIPLSSEFNEYLRLSKDAIADVYWNYKAYCRGRRRTYSEELEAQKKQLIFEMFMPQTRLNIKPSKLEQFVNLLGLAGVIEFCRSINEILQHCTNPDGFFVSPQLLECPFIHIWASLMAADIFFYPDMRPTRSLFTDFEIMASVLPYVDMLATDSYIYELMQRANLSARFRVHIFTVKQRKALITHLRRLLPKYLDNQ